MKNILIIDYDTERLESPIMINKPNDMISKESFESGVKINQMILDDLTTMCNALGELIKIADDRNLLDKNKSATMCIDYLNNNFIDKK